MRLVSKISAMNTTYFILKMDTLDREAITENVGPVNGQWICYSGHMNICPDTFLDKYQLALFCNEVKCTMVFETQRECELYIQSQVYHRAYRMLRYGYVSMESIFDRIKQYEDDIPFHKTAYEGDR